MLETGLRRWLIVITVVSATMIELIDTSIVNVALTEMSGNLGATLEDVAWVVTAYAIANVIVIPITGFLAALFGRKSYYLGSIILFTITSFLCGNATGIWELVFFRFIQGLAGGALLSTSQAILFETFPEEERGKASGIFIVGVVFGPTIGPTLGGWIIDHFSWPWIFYVNLPVGLAAALLTLSVIRDTADSGKRAVKIDWPGIGLLAVGVGALQFVLERGQAEDWFAETYITALTVLAALSLVAFVIWELHTKNPVVNLRVLRSRSLAVAAVLTFILGFGLFGSTFVVPVFAQRILGMTALETGLLLLPSALAAMCVAPISGRLVQAGFPPRILVITGFTIFTFFCWGLSGLTSTMGADNFFWPLILRGAGIACLSVPLTTLAVAGLRGRDLAQGVALNNMMRQLGGSFGIALINTYLARRTFVNRGHLLENINAFAPAAQERIATLTHAFTAQGATLDIAKQRAYAVLEGILTRESTIVSYGDNFRILALFFVLCIPFVFLMKNGKGAKPVADAH